MRTDMQPGYFEDGAQSLTKLFSAPLTAVIDADILLAERIAEFIKAYGFTGSTPGEWGELRMVGFSYLMDGKQMDMKVPALSLIQLPLLQINKADFDMEIKLYTIVEQHENTQNGKNPQDPARTPIDKLSKSLTQPENKGYKTTTVGVMSPNQGGNTTTDLGQSLTANMKVKLDMTSANMPGGLINLLALMSQINQVKEIPDISLSISPADPLINVSQLIPDDEGMLPFHKTLQVKASKKDGTAARKKVLVIAFDDNDSGVYFAPDPDTHEHELMQSTNSFGKALFHITGKIDPGQYSPGDCPFILFLKEAPDMETSGAIKFYGEPTNYKQEQI